MTTRSPTARLVSDGPTSRTIPMGSWPRMSPWRMKAPSVSERWRSDPQMLADATSILASVGSSTFGSGTVSTRTSRLPCQVTAFIATPFGRCGKRTRQQATAELRLSTHAAGAETVSAESVSTVPRKALILVFAPLIFAFPRHGAGHFTRSTSSDRGDLPQASPGGGCVPNFAGECLSVVRPIRPSGRATLHCIIWMSARADPPEGPGFGRGGPGQEHQTKLANLDLVAVDQHRGFDRFMIDVSVVEAVEVDKQELSA